MTATPSEHVHRNRVSHLAAGLLLTGLSGITACAPSPDRPASSAATRPPDAALVPHHELYADAPRSELLAAARRVIEADPVATLITVDVSGRPRARTVDVGGPMDDWIFWVATRPTTRKIDQITRRPVVTLHFETDEQGGYVSVMGTARIHRDDVDLFDRHNPIDADLMTTLFPDFPSDYRLIEIRPVWLEVLTAEVEASTATWRPQAVMFAPEEQLP